MTWLASWELGEAAAARDVCLCQGIFCTEELLLVWGRDAAGQNYIRLHGLASDDECL